LPPRRRRRRPPKVVDRSAPDFALESVIDGMTLEHLQCRDFNHSWRPYTASRHTNGLIERQLRCSRCRTIKVQTLNRWGHVVAGRYDYADGYVIKGLGRIIGEEKDHLRLASINKILTDDTAEEA
jgi:hypothetical protein